MTYNDDICQYHFFFHLGNNITCLVQDAVLYFFNSKDKTKLLNIYRDNIFKRYLLCSTNFDTELYCMKTIHYNFETSTMSYSYDFVFCPTHHVKFWRTKLDSGSLYIGTQIRHILHILMWQSHTNKQWIFITIYYK